MCRELKVLHRDRAARYPVEEDPLLTTTTEQLLDRLLDVKRDFQVVAVLGGRGDFILRDLPKHKTAFEHLIFIDSSQDMLHRVKIIEQEMRRDGVLLPKIMYIRGNEEWLPLRKHSVDLIISNMGLHWINGILDCMFQCQLALKPDGLFLGAMLGGNTLQEFRISFALAEQEREGGVSPRVSPLAQVNDVGSLMVGGGLNLCSIDVQDMVIKYKDTWACIEHIRALGESNATYQRRGQLALDTALGGAALYNSMFRDDDGMIQTTYQVIYMAGWSPHKSQQKPARRGSATASLKELESVAKDRGE